MRSIHPTALRALLSLAWAMTLIVPPAIADLGAPGPSRVVFHTYRWSANPQIALVKPDGSEFSRLTYTTAYEQCPALSPDGTRIAFESTRDGITNRLMVMNVDGSDPHRLTTQPNEEAHASWSRDGARIGCSAVFGGTLGTGGTYDICVMNADGSDLRRLTTDPAHDMGPSFSPDGSRILFTSQRDGRSEIYVMDADGSDQRRLLHKPWETFQAQWSPDGTRIAYMALDPTSQRVVIHVMDADTTGDVVVSDTTMDCGGPSWSPDGTRIVFDSVRDGHRELGTMAADGSDARRVTWGIAGSMAPNWSVAPLDAQVRLGSEVTGHAVRLHWDASPWPGVVGYDVYRSTVAQAATPQRVGQTVDTTFTDTGLLGTFYYRVRAVRASDQSLYSNEDTVVACARSATAFAAGLSVVGVVSGDFDTDGLTDLVVANGTASGKVSFLRGQGDGRFAAPVAYAAGASPAGVVAGDLDDDGDLDLAVANGVTSGSFSVLRGAGDGTFAAPVTYAAGARPVALATADVDEDGIADLVIVERNSNTFSVALGNGTAGLGDGTFAARVSYPTAALPVALVSGDLDADGIVDLAVVGSGAGAVAVHRGHGSGGCGDGTFEAGVLYAVGSGASAIASGDFDEDGHVDLAVGLNTTAGGVMVLRGLGAGAFASAVRVEAGTTVVAVAVGDLDGDGIADLVTANRNAGTVSLVPGRGSAGHGDGTFASPLALTVGVAPAGLVQGDFRVDGLADLAVIHASGTNALMVLPEVCAGSAPMDLALVTPGTAASWAIGSEQAIVWSLGAGLVAVDVELSRDGGLRWETLASGLYGTSLTWTVTEPPSDAVRVRVHDALVPARQVVSTAPLAIAAGVDVEDAGAPPPRLTLERVSPSPTRGPLRVAFTLASGAPATLELIDVAGRRVWSRSLAGLGAGPHSLELADPPGPSSGIHFLRLQQHGHTLVRRVILLR